MRNIKVMPLLTNPERAGFAEVIIPPLSELVGQTIRQLALEWPIRQNTLPEKRNKQHLKATKECQQG